MKQTIQWKNKSIQIDIGLILILILFGLTSCFALYNSFNLLNPEVDIHIYCANYFGLL